MKFVFLAFLCCLATVTSGATEQTKSTNENGIGRLLNLMSRMYEGGMANAEELGRALVQILYLLQGIQNVNKPETTTTASTVTTSQTPQRSQSRTQMSAVDGGDGTTVAVTENVTGNTIKPSIILNNTNISNKAGNGLRSINAAVDANAGTLDVNTPNVDPGRRTNDVNDSNMTNLESSMMDEMLATDSLESSMTLEFLTSSTATPLIEATSVLIMASSSVEDIIEIEPTSSLVDMSVSEIEPSQVVEILETESMNNISGLVEKETDSGENTTLPEQEQNTTTTSGPILEKQISSTSPPTTDPSTNKTMIDTTEPMVGEAGEWGSWTSCSPACGGCGTRRRRRDCSVTGCSISEEKERCGYYACPGRRVSVKYYCYKPVACPQIRYRPSPYSRLDSQRKQVSPYASDPYAPKPRSDPRHSQPQNYGPQSPQKAPGYAFPGQQRPYKVSRKRRSAYPGTNQVGTYNINIQSVPVYDTQRQPRYAQRSYYQQRARPQPQVAVKPPRQPYQSNPYPTDPSYRKTTQQGYQPDLKKINPVKEGPKNKVNRQNYLPPHSEPRPPTGYRDTHEPNPPYADRNRSNQPIYRTQSGECVEYTMCETMYDSGKTCCDGFSVRGDWCMTDAHYAWYEQRYGPIY